MSSKTFSDKNRMVDFEFNLLEKNDDSDFQVFGNKMTGHTGLVEKSKKN